MAYRRPSMESQSGLSKSRANAVKCSRRKFLQVAAGATALTAISRAAWAQGYPSRPVRLIVGFPAGNAPDIIARLTGQFLSERLGLPVVVENRPGAGSNIAAQDVVNAPADGYTLLLAVSTNIFNATLYPKVKFDFIRDVAPVASIANAPFVIVVPPSFPAKTLPEFIAYAKANPGKLNFASQGVGTTSHLTAELFSSITGVKLTHVPYKGTGPALNDIIASHVDLFFTELSTSMQLHKAGKARILAVATKQRVPAIADIPTLDESGVHGCESDTWNAITAPPKTPPAVIAKLNDAANKVMQMPDLLARYKALNATPGGGTPAEMAAFIKEETRRWSAVIKNAGIQPE